jgi:hypothetical protein
MFSYGDESVVIEVIKTLCCMFLSGGWSSQKYQLPIDSPKKITGKWKNRNICSSKKMERKMRRNQGALLRVTQQEQTYQGAK